ncbi:SWIM-type domain-containing protein [Meloidogyne graminicola]|uniref:SWIM-type domain-containing protein n=1 Tax=Meloidogyne graminicola TaxID=189291 RepID=A0A8S9ZS02_9BILA|nr:SWIM-type domain-containing protein [Meloidogyne graminicola]
MENYYCREFMSSSQTAAKLVFNIGNCVDTSRVLRTRPNRPLDSNGREAFVYIMDGAVAHSIKDLTIDDLTPWNSKKCKSSTRFSSVQHDNERNTLIFNRYIISDATSVLYKPECLFACYYCKHPVFDLVKKIFYACDGNRDSCLPGTFVIFAYEFNKAEKIYRTLRNYPSPKIVSNSNNSKTINVGNCSFAANTFIPNQQQFQQPIKSQNSSNNSFQRHFLESNTPLKLEDLTDWSTDLSTDQNGNYNLDNIQDDLTQQMTSTSSTTCLEEILQSCSEQVKNQQKIQRNESLFNNTDDYLNDSNNFLASNDDQNIISRKKRKITFQPISLENHQMPLILNKEVNNKLFLEDKIGGFNSPSSLLAAGDRSISPSSLQSVSVNADCNSRIEQIPNVEENLLFNNYSNYLFTSDVLIENFRKNCFCDGKQLNEQFDFLDEQFLNISSFDENQEEKLLNILKIAKEQNNSFGGCLIIDKSFLIELDISIMITPIWFRNPFFLDKKNKQPVFHPVAIYLNIKNMTEDECHKNILFELKKRLEEDLLINENICRSVFFCSTINLEKNPFIIINQLELLNSFSSLFSSPCIKLISIKQCKKWLRQNFLNLHFGNNNYEENDKKWNEEIENIFVNIESQLFDNKNGILQTLCFEQFISRLRSCERSWPYTFRSWFREKSGWIFEHCSLASRIKAGFNFEHNLELDTTLEPLREELCNNLTAALQRGSKGQFERETVTEALELICTEYLRKSLKAFLENDSSSEIILSNSNNWIGHEHWEKLSEKERRELLLPFGFSSLLNITDSLDPSIFWGLNRKQRRELISRANPLSVMVIDEIKKTNSNDNTSTTKNLNEIFTFVVTDVTKRIANFVQAIDNINNCSLYCQCLGGPLCEHILAIAIKHSSFAKIVPKLLEKSQSLNKSTNLKDNNNNSSSNTPPLLMPGLQLNR